MSRSIAGQDDGRLEEFALRSLDDSELRINEIVSDANLQAPQGALVHVRDYFGKRGETGPDPQAFYVESFPACARTGAHFHEVNQFQVFLPSPGAWYQRSPIDQVTVHYADAYTTYGPFGAGPNQCLSFFTLRPHHSGLTAYMPGSRDQLRARPKRRNQHGSVSAQTSSTSPTIDRLIASDPDGLGAVTLHLGSGHTLEYSADTESDGGQYWLVIDGSVVYRGVEYGELSLGWRAPDSNLPEIVAGSHGARLVVMQFPEDAPELEASSDAERFR